MSLDGSHTVLVLGGIRSGKSEYAESLVADAPDVRYVATGQSPDPARDPEWARRVAEHRDRRPPGWTVHETGDDPGGLVALLAEAKPEETVLLDDLGGWLTAVLAQADWSDAAARDPIAALIDAVRDCVARLVVISPEVGMSLVPDTESGRAFVDAMGAANRALAEVADDVVLVLAGQPTWLKRGGRAVTATLDARPARGARAATVEPDAAALAAGDVAITPGMTLPLPDDSASAASAERLRLLDVPGRGLGSLGTVVSLVAAAQGTETPRPFESVRVLLVYGEHAGDAAAGEMALDWERRLDQARRGEGPLSLLAARAGAAVHIVDTVHAEGLGPAHAIETADAMAGDAVDVALRFGVRTVAGLVEEGTDLLVLASGGPGQDAVASALISRTTSREPAHLLERVLVPGGTVDDTAWMVRCAAVRDALHRTRGPHDALKLLSTLGGPDFAVAVGILVGAASLRVPVVLDGPVGMAAALVARELATQVRLWVLVLDDNPHPAARAGIDVLSLEPLVKLGLGLGEGANALVALPLVQAGLLLSTLDTVAPAAGPDGA